MTEQIKKPESTSGWWPIHGVVEAIRADAIRIHIPGFRRGAQIYDGPIPPAMPGWAMVEGIEFQAEIPWSDAEACHFDPAHIRRIHPLPFEHIDLRQRIADLEAALAPFADLAEGIPDNWPGQCRLRIDQRRDHSDYLAYHGEPEEPLGVLPFIREWKAAEKARKP